MELSYFATAVRRRWWLVAAIALVGVAVAFSLDTEQDAEYQAEALVLVVPDPARSDLYAGRPDRFIASELASLRTTQLADAVAARLPAGTATADEVLAATSAQQVDETDIVSITATTSQPEAAVAIVNAYATTYVEQLQARAGSTAQLLAEVDAQLQDIIAQLQASNAQLQAATAPYIQRQLDDPSAPIPNMSVIAPELELQRNLLQSQYSQVLSYRFNLERTAREANASAIVETASEARAVEGASPVLVPAAVALAALLLALAAAPLSLAFSKRPTDLTFIERAIGYRIVGHIPFSLRRYRSPVQALTHPDRPSAEVEQRLWAMIEWGRGSSRTAVVAVAGAARNAGTTTLVMALARRAAMQGQRVVVVGADTLNPWLSEVFPADDGAADERRTPAAGAAPLVPTPLDEVSVLPAAPALLRDTPLRDVVQRLVDMEVDVVLIDVGKLLASAQALAACEIAQSVVITLPVGQLTEKDIRDTEVVLSDVAKGQVLPVTTRPGRQIVPRRSSGSQRTGVTQH